MDRHVSPPNFSIHPAKSHLRCHDTLGDRKESRNKPGENDIADSRCAWSWCTCTWRVAHQLEMWTHDSKLMWTVDLRVRVYDEHPRAIACMLSEEPQIRS